MTDEPAENPAASGRCIFIFDSIHYVLAAERALKERGLWCDLVPTPKDLSPDCGMAIETRASDAATARAILSDPRFRHPRMYVPEGGGYREEA